MDNTRLFLYASLTLVLFLVWGAWQDDYGTPPRAGTTETTETNGAIDAPAERASRPDDLPGLPPDDVPAAPTAEARGAEPSRLLSSEHRIHVRTDVLDLELDTAGADIRSALLLDYPLDKRDPDQPFPLFSDTLPMLFVLQGGLVSEDAAASPTHHANWRAERSRYVLPEGADTLRVPFHWQDGEGLRVTRTYVFNRGDYAVTVEHAIVNERDTPWRGSPYLQFQRTDVPPVEPSWFVHTFMGAAIHDGEGYRKLPFDDIVATPLAEDHIGGWAAMVQHYFVAAAIPPGDASNHYYTRMLDGPRYVVGVRMPAVSLEPGASTILSSRLWLGPKLQDRLAGIAQGLDRTVDYGWLTFLSQPLFWLLDKIHMVTGNWGWAIIVLTVLIKLAFYKLSETSYRSMANMRKIQPRLKTLQERYKDDRQRLNQAMMDLYKKEKINPLGGCLPILVQIPVFIALYWVLLESVELRQAPWMLWIDDLSSRDPYFVLPFLMGASMFLQQRLNPAPVDPVQQKVMKMLPFIFTVFFAFFPSGLVLYWMVNNVISLAQQWYITSKLEAAKS